MIVIKKSPTADTRTCDFANVTREQLYESSMDHIRDVRQALYYFQDLLGEAGKVHDKDKLTDIDRFHSDFVGGFKSTVWWDRHRILNRHHLTHEDGIPSNVNLIDVLDYIADCVMAGMARNGTVYPIEIKMGVLHKAFENTVDLLKQQVKVLDE